MFLGVPLGTPTGLPPHQLYLYVSLYLRSLAYPSAHPQVSTLTNCISIDLMAASLFSTTNYKET